MRIAVVNLPSVDGGGLSVLRGLHAFAGRHAEHEWLFAVGPQELGSSPHLRVQRFPGAAAGLRGRARAELRDLPAAIRIFAPDVTLSLQNTRIRGVPGLQWVYLHQPLPFQSDYSFSFRRREERDAALRQHVHGRMIKASLRKSDGVFVQSAWMHSAVSAAIGPDVSVVNAGLPPVRRSQRMTTAEPGTGSYFLYPAGPFVYKNYRGLHRAVTLVRQAGDEAHVRLTLTETEFRWLASVPASETLDGYHFMGRVSPETVDEMYADSTLVFPSFIETVGLPLLEARAQGRFVLAADCAYAREVMDGYRDVIFFDPFDPRDLAQAMLKVLRGKVEFHRSDPTTTPAGSSWDTVLGVLVNAVKGGAS